jgi:hypothetical protein
MATNHITYDHYATFGMIINIIADIDILLDKIITTMLIRPSKVTSLEDVVKEHPTILPLLTMLSSRNKIDYIVNRPGLIGGSNS